MATPASGTIRWHIPLLSIALGIMMMYMGAHQQFTFWKVPLFTFTDALIVMIVGVLMAVIGVALIIVKIIYDRPQRERRMEER